MGRIEFRGKHRQCGNQSPHFPHVMWSHSTRAGDPLCYFCLGVPGEGVRFRVEYATYGVAPWPDTALIVLEGELWRER